MGARGREENWQPESRKLHSRLGDVSSSLDINFISSLLAFPHLQKTPLASRDIHFPAEIFLKVRSLTYCNNTCRFDVLVTKHGRNVVR